MGIENLGDGGWSNNGWSRYKKEIEETFRQIINLGYALIFVSHEKDKTFTRKDGTSYNQIVPTAQSSINEIVKNMVDLYCYVSIKEDGSRKLIFRSNDGTIDCKSRFKYMPAEVDLSYEALKQAVNEAIDAEEKLKGKDIITNEKVVQPIIQTYDYDALMKEFQTITGDLMHKDPSYGPKITAIVDKYLGKGKKVSEATPDQAEFINLINEEIKADLMK